MGRTQQTAKRKIPAYIVDDTNRIQILQEGGINFCAISKEEQHGKYISLIPLTKKVEGVTLQGAMYPLEQATIYQESSLAVSNQIEGKQIQIKIETGSVLVIESRDAI